MDNNLQRSETENLTIRASDGYPLPERSVANVRRGRISFATNHYNRQNVYSDRGVRDLLTETGVADPDGALLQFQLSVYEQANVQDELREAYENLLGELNQNLYRYHKAIWWNMDRDALYTLLDGFAGDEEGRSIASLVERRPIGILGNTLVFRVSAGTLLDPNFGSPEALLDYYRAETPKADPVRVSLPTSIDTRMRYYLIFPERRQARRQGWSGQRLTVAGYSGPAIGGGERSDRPKVVYATVTIAYTQMSSWNTRAGDKIDVRIVSADNRDGSEYVLNVGEIKVTKRGSWLTLDPTD